MCLRLEWFIEIGQIGYRYLKLPAEECLGVMARTGFSVLIVNGFAMDLDKCYCIIH